MTRLLVLAAVAAAATRADAQSITPKFAWPSSAEAEVLASGVSRTSRAGREDSSRYSTRSRMEVRPDARGLLISSGPTQTVDGAMAPSVSGPSIEGMLKLVTRYVVSTGGRYLGLTDTITFKRAVDSAAQPFLQQLASLPPQMRDGVTSMFSIATLNKQAERNWSQQFGALVTQSWAPGDSLLFAYTEPLPTLPGAEIPFRQTLRYVGVVACPTGNSAPACWRFTLQTSIELAAFRTLLLQSLRRLGVEDESMLDQIPIPRTSISQELTYDPKTSRPLEIRMQSSIETAGSPAMSVPGSNAQMTVPGSSVRTDVVTRYIWK